jgi:hypothetical protein
VLNLEETVTPATCAFAIERSKGVFLAKGVFLQHRLLLFSSPCAEPQRSEEEWVAHFAASRFTQSQELYMSARNGDKSRFNRQRKQKIARRKHTPELLERAAKARESADTTVRAQPRSAAA